MTEVFAYSQRKATVLMSRIAVALLVQTARDLVSAERCLGKEESFSVGSRWGSVRRRRSMEVRERIRDWLSGDVDHGLFSLSNCCRYINDFIDLDGLDYPHLSPDVVREALLSIPETLVSRMAAGDGDGAVSDQGFDMEGGVDGALLKTLGMHDISSCLGDMDLG